MCVCVCERTHGVSSMILHTLAMVLRQSVVFSSGRLLFCGGRHDAGINGRLMLGLRSKNKQQTRHLHHKVCGCFAERFHHGHGFCVEQRHPVGHLVVDFVLNFQLTVKKRDKRDH